MTDAVPAARRPSPRGPLRAWCALALALLVGCGLVARPAPIGFRAYPLRDVDSASAFDAVRDVTRRFATERFGGVTLSWDEAGGNLELDPVYDGARRMRLFMHLEPAGPDVLLELFALVEHLDPSEPGIVYTLPMQDVPLEEALYAEIVAELVARRAAPAREPVR